ncbi:hypothetical protein CEUSTIGMA_g767.t1 [Chlamydomonas eustigma]|uniref:Rubisco LSMT substrate-binding domain-containing protein n=1 Tax=Chlamydomonas eustigma TaxID=1157962 RepID=A0A250WR69_9CHLO|nr:hypothetical protein CEUSTIGMA_g767.t1 [Chlamydomonas eustigma]|eukprot:GAX73313.1 hypothetical protein CEUSTIGMA_g767.t1 [Chlamydomonas eustigma]
MKTVSSIHKVYQAGQWLSVTNMNSHPKLGKALSTCQCEPWVRAALILVQERFVSGSPTNSVWSKYVSSLPSTLPLSPLLWSEENLKQIKGTQMLESTLAYKAFFTSKFEELQQTLFTRNSDVFALSAFTLENFIWGAVMVRSRVHGPLEGESLALVPLADAVLHSRKANVMWQARSSGLFGRGKAIAVEAVRNIKQGDALAMDYGSDRLDNELLLDYGVLDSANSRAGYSLNLEMSSASALGNVDDKLDILELNGMSGSATFKITPDAQPGANMLGFLRLMQLKGADTFLLESVFRNEVWGHLTQPVAEDNEKAICTSMIEGAQAALSGYPTSIAQDRELLSNGNLVKGSVEEAALLVRLGEKEALESLLFFFEQRLTEVSTIEYYQERRLKRLGLMDDRGNTTYNSFFEKGIA